jgi:dUTP pyrophosphatase
MTAKKKPVKAKAATVKALTLKVFKTHPDIVLPKLATEESACFDIAAQFAGKGVYQLYNANNRLFERHFSNNQLKIMPGDRVAVPTGLIFDIPKGYSVRFHARSGLSFKQGLVMANAEAIIDSDFVHEVSVLITNVSNNDIVISNGDRIAQGELVRVEDYVMAEIKEAPRDKTSRKGGLGSTGVGEKVAASA